MYEVIWVKLSLLLGPVGLLIPFLIHMSVITHMDVCNESRVSGQPAVLRCKNFKIGHYMQNNQPNFFIPAMLIGTVHFYHLIPLSLTLTLPGVTRFSKQNCLAPCSYSLFDWPGWHLIWYWNTSWFNILMLILSEIFSSILSIWSGWKLMWE